MGASVTEVDEAAQGHASVECYVKCPTNICNPVEDKKYNSIQITIYKLYIKKKSIYTYVFIYLYIYIKNICGLF